MSLDYEMGPDTLIPAIARRRPEVLRVPAASSANRSQRRGAYFSTSDQTPFHSAHGAVTRN
jgi:hypothetical protein